MLDKRGGATTTSTSNTMSSLIIEIAASSRRALSYFRNWYTRVVLTRTNLIVVQIFL
jgi:hypothetical protein